ncbi:MAG: hypothetical protein AAFW82_06260, partial [Pseudomonadota bacterium]
PLSLGVTIRASALNLAQNIKLSKKTIEISAAPHFLSVLSVAADDKTAQQDRPGLRSDRHAAAAHREWQCSDFILLLCFRRCGGPDESGGFQ